MQSALDVNMKTRFNKDPRIYQLWVRMFAGENEGIIPPRKFSSEFNYTIYSYGNIQVS